MSINSNITWTRSAEPPAVTGHYWITVEHDADVRHTIGPVWWSSECPGCWPVGAVAYSLITTPEPIENCE